MKLFGKICLMALSLSLVSFMAIVTNWKISDDYVIKLETSKVSGTIGGLSGVVSFDPTDLKKSTIDVSVDVNTLDLGNSLKNSHAKNDGFLDVEKYSKIKFKSASFVKKDNGYVVAGNLTIKDVTKPVNIPFSFIPGTNSGEFVGQFKVNRLDFNLEKRGVGEILDITIKLPVTK